MILTLDHGWAIADIEGNPYSTNEACNIMRMTLVDRRMMSLHGLQFAQIGCFKEVVRRMK